MAWGETTVKDEQIAPNFWPANLQDRRNLKMGIWHSEWTKRTVDRADFRPQGRKEGSDYNLHYVDVEAPFDAEIDFDRRAREIQGHHPRKGGRLPDPSPAERLRGALVAATVGDAFGHAIEHGTVTAVPWSPDYRLRDEHALTEYSLTGPTPSTSVGQLLAFSLEGVIRSHVAGRTTGDPALLSRVQYAYQRWLFTQPTSDGRRRDWRACAGQYSPAPGPDGWLVGAELVHADGKPQADLVTAVEEVARTGRHATFHDLRGHARGADAVLPPVAAALCSNDSREVFTTAVKLAVLTHDRPEDCLPAGVLAVILHQQIRDRPFTECLATAREQLRRWNGHTRVERTIERAWTMIRDYRVPTSTAHLRKPFPNGGRDGAEALGLALYCAMASDYVREALELAANYATNRPVVAAIAGLLLGADFGVQAVPDDLREAVPLTTIVDTLAQDATAEFTTTPPTDPHWLARYPAS